MTGRVRECSVAAVCAAQPAGYDRDALGRRGTAELLQALIAEGTRANETRCLLVSVSLQRAVDPDVAARFVSVFKETLEGGLLTA